MLYLNRQIFLRPRLLVPNTGNSLHLLQQTIKGKPLLYIQTYMSQTFKQNRNVPINSTKTLTYEISQKSAR